MMSSINRSISSLSLYGSDSSPPFDLVEAYIAKKTYYPPAINRVLAVLDKGYKHRVTLNGEIGRNYDDLREQWTEIQSQIVKQDETLANLGMEAGQGVGQGREGRPRKLSIVTEPRPRSAGSTSNSTSTSTTLTQSGVSPPASLDLSVRSQGQRVSSLPPQPTRRDSYLTPQSTPRTRSVSTATSTSSRLSRFHLPIFTPRSKTPSITRPGTAPSLQGTGTGGLIPIQARPRWNASPIANVLGSPPPKIPAVVVTPSRIPKKGMTSGRATPTLKPPQPVTPPTHPRPGSAMAAPHTTSPVKPKIPIPSRRLS